MCYISDIHQGITLLLFLYTIAVQTAIISYLTRISLLRMGFGAQQDAIEKYLMSAVFIDSSMFVLVSILELTGYTPHIKYKYEVMIALAYLTWMVFFPDSHIRKFLKSQIDKHI